MPPPVFAMFLLLPRETEATGLPMPGLAGPDPSIVVLPMEVVLPIEAALPMGRPIVGPRIADPAVVALRSDLPIPDLFM